MSKLKQTEIQKQKEKMIKDIQWNIEWHKKKLKACELELEILTNNK